jgi:four helix bundle protein
MQYAFDHETLDSYRLALDIARWISSVKFPAGTADLRDHGVRAARSVVLNIAEGRSRGGDAGRNHYRIALGSAAEVCSVLDLVVLPQGEEQQQKLRRVGAMLRQMVR